MFCLNWCLRWRTPFLPLFLHIQRPRIIGGDTGFELGFLPQKSGVYQRAATSPNKKTHIYFYVMIWYDILLFQGIHPFSVLLLSRNLANRKDTRLFWVTISNFKKNNIFSLILIQSVLDSLSMQRLQRGCVLILRRCCLSTTLTAVPPSYPLQAPQLLSYNQIPVSSWFIKYKWCLFKL